MAPHQPDRLTTRGTTEAPVTLIVTARAGTVRLTTLDCPFVAEAILTPAQVPRLIEMLTRARTEALRPCR